MKFETKVRILLHKKYFDKGYSFYGMIKYAFAGMIVLDYFLGLSLSCLYAVACYVFGRLYYRHDWEEADIEVSNRFNRFVKEMRSTYKNN